MARDDAKVLADGIALARAAVRALADLEDRYRAEKERSDSVLKTKP